MKKILLMALCFIAAFATDTIHAQSLPSGTCGIVYTYDAAGNRTKRVFVLNNSLQAAKTITVNGLKVAAKDILKVDVLYPNPTTRHFTVRLVSLLKETKVTITDISGRTLIQRTENGNVLNYDLTGQPTGVYILRITQEDKSISIKVIKK